MQQVLEEAKALQDRYNNPDDAIWQALSNSGVTDRSTRIRTFKEVKTELSRALAHERKREQEEREIIEEDRREQMLRDAWAHQMSQPRDAWDPWYEKDDSDVSDELQK
ncbi:hypothetical protein FJZ23_02565 [Candidatus Parcubacteria bacterium]|nr:hypothetical protein [Candidatus Parcubacteria bacterium]